MFILNTGCMLYGFSPRCHKESMSSDTYQLIAETICHQFPMTPVHCRSDRPLFPNSIPLDKSAMFFEYVVIEGKQYHASRMTGTARSSLAHVVIPGLSPVNAFGEVMEIIQVHQQFPWSNHPLCFVRMRWFKPWSGEHEQLWDEL